MKALLVAVVAVLSGGADAGADGGAGAVARAAGKGAAEMSVVAAGLGAGVSKVGVFVKVCGRREVLTMAHTVYRS